MRVTIVLLMTIVVMNAYAQSGYGTTTVYDRGQKDLPTDSTYYTLPANQFWHKQAWRDSVYLFPDFQQGRLEFANGFSPSTRLIMNYNIFLESISVAEENGDVSLLKKFRELKFIYIGDHKFYYVPDLGYLEIVLAGNISVAKRTVMASVLETSNGFKYRITGLDVKTQTNKYARYYWPVELYYILDPGYKMYRAGSLVLPSILPEQKEKIKDFVEVNKINYRKPDDVLKVVKYCNEIFDPKTRAARKIEPHLVAHSMYRFASFTETSLVYDDGRKGEIEMNYNYITGRFETISQSGDTVDIKTSNKILLTNTDGIMFFNDPAQGPVEVVLQGNVGLGLKKRIVPSTFTVERSWFFLNKNKAIVASARSLLALYPSHRKEITQYISTNSTNFDSKDDLTKLLSYCSTL